MTDTETSHATLIKWNGNVDPKRIERWLTLLQEQGYIEYHNTQDFNPEHSSPILYFP
jgi:hypothetical protein